jgi:NADH:ubiquinone oxidoreductase subunit 4 (subunit M)
MLIPLAVITIFLGVYPKPMMDLIDTPLTSLIEVIKPAADALKTAAGG